MSNPSAGGRENILDNPIVTLHGDIVGLKKLAQIGIGLFGFAAVAFVGNVGYFYKETSSLKQSFGGLQGAVESLQTSVGRLDGLISKNADQIAMLDRTIIRLDTTVEHLEKSVTKISDQADRIEESAEVIKTIKNDLNKIRNAIEKQNNSDGEIQSRNKNGSKKVPFTNQKTEESYGITP